MSGFLVRRLLRSEPSKTIPGRPIHVAEKMPYGCLSCAIAPVPVLTVTVTEPISPAVEVPFKTIDAGLNEQVMPIAEGCSPSAGMMPLSPVPVTFTHEAEVNVKVTGVVVAGPMKFAEVLPALPEITLTALALWMTLTTKGGTVVCTRVDTAWSVAVIVML